MSHGEDAQEVGALVNSRRGIRSRTADRSVQGQTRSARVRETFRLCPGGEQSTSCSLSEAFFSVATRRTGRESVYVVVVLGSRASPAAGRSSIPLSRPRTKNQRAILISLFCHVRGNPRENRGRSLAYISTFLFSISALNDLYFKETTLRSRADP